jgi:hypothetical protein
MSEFMYPKADQYAQPEIKAAVARFRELPLEEREKLPLLWWLLNDTTQAFKPSKKESLYTDFARTGTQRCDNCSYSYLNIHHRVYICSQIRGCIKMTGWCKYWERVKENPYLCEKQEERG